MSDVDKARAATKYIADNYKYSTGASSAFGMFTTGGGDCWASADAIIQICNRMGIKAWKHDARYESGAGNGHANAFVEIDGKIYECEAGYAQYNSDGTRPYSFSETPKYSTATRLESGGTRANELIRVNAYDDTVIDVPDGIKYIGKISNDNGDFSAFSGASYAETVKLPASVIEIDTVNFAGVKANFEVSPDNQAFMNDENGNLLSKDGTTFMCSNTKNQTVVIPSTVKKISEYGVYLYNNNVQQIVMNEGLEELGQGAIYYNKTIKKLIFPSTLKKVDSKAFWAHSATTFIFKSMDTEFEDGCFTASDTIIAPKGSTAEAAANKIGATFIELTSDTDLSQPAIVEKTKYVQKEYVNKTDAETKAEIEAATKALNEAKSDYEKKKSRYDSLKNSSAEDLIATAKKAMDEAASTVVDKTAALSDAQKAKAEADKAKTNAETDVNSKNQKINEINEKIEDLNNQKTALDATVTTKTSELEQAKSDYNDSVNARNTAQTELEDANANLQTAKDNFNALFENVTKLKEEARAAKEKADKAQTAYDNAILNKNAKKDALDKANEEYKKTQEALADAQEALANAKTEYEEAQKDADEKKSVFDEKSGIADGTRKALEEATTAYNKAVTDANNANAELATANKELQEAKDNVVSTLEDLDKVNANVESAKENLDDLSDKLDAAKKTYEEAKSPIDELQKAYDKAKKEYDEAVDALQKAKGNVPTATDFDALEKDVADKKAALSKAETALGTAKQTLSDAETSYKVAKDSYDTAEKAYKLALDAVNAEEVKNKSSNVSKKAVVNTASNSNGVDYVGYSAALITTISFIGYGIMRFRCKMTD